MTERQAAEPLATHGEEAFRALRTALLLQPDVPPRRKLLVAPADSGRAGARVAAGLARSIARSGLRVVALDCDLRHPQAHELLALPNGQGLAEWLADGGDGPLLQDGPDGIRFLAAGAPTRAAPELIGSPRFDHLLSQLLEHADHLVCNAPPLDGAPDAAALATRMDAVLLVLRAGRTTRETGASAIAMLGRVNAPLLGTVLVEGS